MLRKTWDIFAQENVCEYSHQVLEAEVVSLDDVEVTEHLVQYVVAFAQFLKKTNLIN